MEGTAHDGAEACGFGVEQSRQEKQEHVTKGSSSDSEEEEADATDFEKVSTAEEGADPSAAVSEGAEKVDNAVVATEAGAEEEASCDTIVVHATTAASSAEEVDAATDAVATLLPGAEAAASCADTVGDAIAAATCAEEVGDDATLEDGADKTASWSAIFYDALAAASSTEGVGVANDAADTLAACAEAAAACAATVKDDEPAGGCVEVGADNEPADGCVEEEGAAAAPTPTCGAEKRSSRARRRPRLQARARRRKTTRQKTKLQTCNVKLQRMTSTLETSSTFFCMKNKQSFNDHDAEVIQCFSSLVQVKFQQGPLKGPAVHKLTYDKIIRIVKSAKPTDQGAAKATTSAAGPTAQGDAAATSAAASTSPLAAAFNASSKGKSIDIERELEAVLEEKEAEDQFEELGPLA